MDIDDHTITLCYNARTKGDENPCDLCSPSKLMRRLTSLQGRREQGAPHTSGHCPLCSHIQSHGSTQDEHLPIRTQEQQDEIVSKMPGAVKNKFLSVTYRITALPWTHRVITCSLAFFFAWFAFLAVVTSSAAQMGTEQRSCAGRLTQMTSSTHSAS